MEAQVSIILGITGLVIFIFVVWRLVSRRRSLPCPVWLRWLVELDNPFFRTNRAGVIVGHLGLQPGMSILDAGCGPGRLTIPIAQCVGEGGEVVAMDIQSGMLDRVQERARAANLTNIRLLHAGIGEGRLGRNRFDRALLVTVLGEIPDREAAVKEIFDALKPGGILSVTEIIFDPHFQRRSAVARLAGNTGLRKKAIYGSRIAYTMNFEKCNDG